MPIHRKYKLSASCFAYVGDANDPNSWSPPYKNTDGSIDEKRLRKAIQALLTNYRGARLRCVPEKAVPGVLQILARNAVLGTVCRVAGHGHAKKPVPAPSRSRHANAIISQPRWYEKPPRHAKDARLVETPVIDRLSDEGLPIRVRFGRNAAAVVVANGKSEP